MMQEKRLMVANAISWLIRARLILMVVVHAASVQDRDGAKLVFNKIFTCFLNYPTVWADAGYAGSLIDWVKYFIELKGKTWHFLAATLAIPHKRHFICIFFATWMPKPGCAF